MSPAPLKKYGQHFLISPSFVQKIIEAASIGPDDAVLEIGPGLGVITEKWSHGGAKKASR